MPENDANLGNYVFNEVLAGRPLKSTNIADTTWAIIGVYWQNKGEIKPRPM